METVENKTEKTHKKILTNTKNWYHRNKTKMLGAALIATATYAVLMNNGRRECNKFLAEKDLLEEFYLVPEDYEEFKKEQDD